MKNFFIILGFNVCFLFSCVGQPYSFELSKEEIVKKDKNIIKNDKELSWFSITGYGTNNLSITYRDAVGQANLWLYDENKRIAINDMPIVQENKKIVSAYKKDELLILSGYYEVSSVYMKTSLFELPEQFEYYDFWAQLNGKTFKITTFPNYFTDKPIYFKVSMDKKYLICNPYYEGIYLRADEEDNVIILYDLRSLEENEVKEQIIPCERCYNTYVINDTLLFGKEFTLYDTTGMEYTYSNIYKAPINNINDTILIARNIELRSITPDGKFILGKNRLYGENFAVIMDVEAKRYQYIIGREYQYKNSFYSLAKNKFAFDFDNEHFIYVDFPEEYPYDAFKPFKGMFRNEQELFWKDKEIKTHKPIK